MDRLKTLITQAINDIKPIHRPISISPESPEEIDYGKYKIFIAEGPDGVGKTSLSKFLHALYDLPVVHLTYFENQDDLELQFEYVLTLLEKIEQNPYKGIIFDRFLESNIVYSDVFKDTKKTRYCSAIYYKLNELANKGVDITYIKCNFKSKKAFIDKFNEMTTLRGELYGDKLQEMEEVYDKYEEMWDKTCCVYSEKIKHINYDMSDESAILEMKELVGITGKILNIL